MQSHRRYRVIPIDSIYVPRTERQRSELELEALKKSIQKIGLLQPIVVEQHQYGVDLDPDRAIATSRAVFGYFWKLVAGECRLAACRELGWREIPAIAIGDLTPVDAQIAELEENIKRTNLNWQDFCRATARIHKMFCELHPEWTQIETSEALSITEGKLSEQLRVYSYIDDPRVVEAGTLREAYNIIRRRETRQRGDVLMELLEEPEQMKDGTPTEFATSEIEIFESSDGTSLITTRHNSFGDDEILEIKPNTSGRDRTQLEAESTILNVSFFDWAPVYSGPKFNFLHCDFPYGIDHGTSKQSLGAEHQAYEDSIKTYTELLECLTANLERLLSISSHVMFWFSERNRRLTIQHFKTHAPSLKWQTFPLIWVKSDSSGIAADHSRNPRHTYETCMLGSRGERMLVRTMADAYVSKSDHRLHPSTKPEPMLKHFMTMLVDENTRMLDPTCGSGSSIRAAETLGAKHIQGLEIDPNYWRSAVIELRNRRMLRNFGI